MLPKTGHELLTTNRKALTINLGEGRYGTFAEIGAGQKVARSFFRASGPSGTVANTISAYNMAFSDAKLLGIFASEGRRMIISGDSSWVDLVPEAVVPVVRDQGLFGLSK